MLTHTQPAPVTALVASANPRWRQSPPAEAANPRKQRPRRLPNCRGGGGEHSAASGAARSGAALQCKRVEVFPQPCSARFGLGWSLVSARSGRVVLGCWLSLFRIRLIVFGSWGSGWLVVVSGSVGSVLCSAGRISARRFAAACWCGRAGRAGSQLGRGSAVVAAASSGHRGPLRDPDIKHDALPKGESC